MRGATVVGEGGYGAVMGTLPADAATTGERHRRQAWLRRIGECVLVTALMAGLVTALALTGLASPCPLARSVLITVLTMCAGN